MPRKEVNPYCRAASVRYVRLLCLWRYFAPEAFLHRRDPHEYRKALLNLIEVNKKYPKVDPDDKSYQWEIEAAENELKALGK